MGKIKLAALVIFLVWFLLLSSCSGNQQPTPTGQYFSKEALVNLLSESGPGYDNDDFLVNIKDPQRNGMKEIQKSTYTLVIFTLVEEIGIGLDGKERRQEGMIVDRGRGLVLEGGYVLPLKVIFWEEPPPIPVPPGPNPPPVTLAYKKLDESVFIATFKGQNNFADSPRLEKVFVDNKQPFVLLKIPDWENFKKANDIHYFPFDLGNSDKLDIGDYLEIATSPLGTDYVSPGKVGGFTLPDDILGAVSYQGEQIFTFSNPILTGDGGSPIMAFENGEYKLVGIVIGYLGQNVQGFSWGMKINFITEMIKEKTGLDLRGLK